MADLCPHDGDPRSCPPCQDGPTPRRIPTRTGVPTFVARYAGRCPGCGFDIEPGDQATYVGQLVYHTGCTDA